jgi:hypothetical protein
MSRGWIAWSIATLILIAYAAAGRIESHTAISSIKLTRGATDNLDLLRLFKDELRFSLGFKAQGCQQRPELGNASSDRSWKTTGLLKLTPGAAVTIEASHAHAAPVIFDAMPLSGFCSDRNLRDMTADLPIAPGVYRWPPPAATPSIPLLPGFNHVILKVQKIGQPLLGEVVTIIVQPPLGFNEYFGNTCWLWPALLLWPLFTLVQILWAVGLAWATYRKRRRRRIDPSL